MLGTLDVPVQNSNTLFVVYLMDRFRSLWAFLLKVQSSRGQGVSASFHGFTSLLSVQEVCLSMLSVQACLSLRLMLHCVFRINLIQHKPHIFSETKRNMLFDMYFFYFCMSKKSCPFSCSKYTTKIKKDFWTDYSINNGVIGIIIF